MPRYDIHFQPVMPPEDQFGYKVFTFGFKAALGISGAQALVNRWTKTFITPKGSDLLHPSYGTEFGNLPGSNILGDFGMLQDVVVMAIEDANEQVHAQESEYGIILDDNEMLDSAAFGWLSPTAGKDGFHVGIIINNMAGQSLPFKLTLAATR